LKFDLLTKVENDEILNGFRDPAGDAQWQIMTIETSRQ
jgi:hypothetical protein